MRGGGIEVKCPKCGSRGRSRLSKAKEAVMCNMCRTVIRWTAPGQFQVVEDHVRRAPEPAPALPPVRLGRLAVFGAGVGAALGVAAAAVLGWVS